MRNTSSEGVEMKGRLPSKGFSHQVSSSYCRSPRACSRSGSALDVPRTRPKVSTSSIEVRRTAFMTPFWNIDLRSKNGVSSHGTKPTTPILCWIIEGTNRLSSTRKWMRKTSMSTSWERPHDLASAVPLSGAVVSWPGENRDACTIGSG